MHACKRISMVSVLVLFLVLRAATESVAHRNLRNLKAVDGISPDEAALLLFKASIRQDPFGALASWTPGNLCRSWSHVVCNSQLRITTLNLQDQLLLADSISNNLSDLVYLQILNLQNNSFSGQVPPFLGNLAYLQEIRLGLNPLTGNIPPELLSLAGLAYLDIARTRISGSIPSSVNNLVNIAFLYLDNTNLNGPIPQEFGSLTKLQTLHLYQDFPTAGVGQLTGSLPDFSILSGLTDLNLANNALTGGIPNSYTRLQSLIYMNVSGNSLSGNIPPELLELPSLRTLDISSNNLNGTITRGLIKNFVYGNNPNLRVACVGKCSHGSKLGAPVIVSIVLAITLAIVAAGLFGWTWHHRKGAVEQRRTKPAGQAVEQHQPNPARPTSEPDDVTPNFEKELKPPIYTRSFNVKELMIATNNFNPDNVIGTGAFGLVYKGKLLRNEIVAIKRAGEASQQGTEEFFNEVELLSKIHHKHLVNLCGYCADAGEQMLIYEYVPNGTLLEHLTGLKGVPLSWRQRVRIAICAAKGLAYLHEGCSPPIIHRDIKPSNILLDYEYGAKVSDFGLSREGPSGSKSHVSTAVKGTPGYLDPHYYLSFHLSTASDVYSFGVILLQLVSAKPAVDHTRPRAEYHISNWAKQKTADGDIEGIMDPTLLCQEYNRDILLHIAKLGLRCVAKDAKIRPTMTEVCQELELVLRTYDTAPRPPEEPQSNRYITMSALNNEENSCDFYEQERFYPGAESQTSMDSPVGPDYSDDPSLDASVDDSAEFYKRASVGTSDDVEDFRTPSRSGSIYDFPLDKTDSNIKFDGMAWVDIKNIDDERLQQFSGSMKFEVKLHEFTGNIELSETPEENPARVRRKSALKSAPL